jgi:multimeric flavodoxin WrbA
MESILILDKDAESELAENLSAGILRVLSEQSYSTEVVGLDKKTSTPCLGCLGCLTTHPGECVNRDDIDRIHRNANEYSLTIYLTPVLFGHFSSTIKNAIDRGTGSNNRQVFIGYGSDMNNEEKSTFIDLIAKHCGKADIIHPGTVRQADAFVTASMDDNAAICETLKKSL